MPLKIVRNDITRMDTEAIVNTANDWPSVGTGCDTAVHNAAGFDQLLEYRIKNVGENGFVPEGHAFITPGFNLKSKYIIHAVSPFYIDGEHGEEERLRSCYRESLRLAKEHNVASIAFPLISTGGFGYPLDEGIRIAADEINAFLLENEMLIYIVVFNKKATKLSQQLSPNTESYIDADYVNQKHIEEYGEGFFPHETDDGIFGDGALDIRTFTDDDYERLDYEIQNQVGMLEEKFQPYLFRLIEAKGLTFIGVRKKALISTKNASKIRTNPDYQPSKQTALCLCIGLMLNLSEAKHFLSMAGYAFSPNSKQDIIFRYFIEHKIYNMTELDIQLENNGLPCIIE